MLSGLQSISFEPIIRILIGLESFVFLRLLEIAPAISAPPEMLRLLGSRLQLFTFLRQWDTPPDDIIHILLGAANTLHTIHVNGPAIACCFMRDEDNENIVETLPNVTRALLDDKTHWRFCSEFLSRLHNVNSVECYGSVGDKTLQSCFKLCSLRHVMEWWA